MKKIFLILCALILSACSILTGCTFNNKDGKINIVCTIFPIYDWVKEIVGASSNENVNVSYLLENGSEIHSYEPSMSDIAKISSCDLFIYIGGESDGWVTSVLSQKKNNNMIILNLLEILGDNVKEEEIKEGMQETEEDEEENSQTEYDEHIWLSLKNCKYICNKILDAIKSIDNENATSYIQNLKTFESKLTELDNSYTEAVQNAKQKTILFGDRFPFRYLVDDYDLDYYAAFVGCSAETNASFETITFLVNKVDELNLKVIFTIEGNNNGIAETIKSHTSSKNQKILVLNSMQSVSKNDIKNGTTYLSIMTQNLENLKQGLEV